MFEVDGGTADLTMEGHIVGIGSYICHPSSSAVDNTGRTKLQTIVESWDFGVSKERTGSEDEVICRKGPVSRFW